MNTIIVSLNYVNFYTGDTLGLLGYGETAWGFTLKQEGEDGSRDSQREPRARLRYVPSTAHHLWREAWPLAVVYAGGHLLPTFWLLESRRNPLCCPSPHRHGTTFSATLDLGVWSPTDLPRSIFSFKKELNMWYCIVLVCKYYIFILHCLWLT